jgi:hypothetical protein
MDNQKQQAYGATSRSIFIQSEKDDFVLQRPNVVLLGFLALVAMFPRAQHGSPVACSKAILVTDRVRGSVPFYLHLSLTIRGVFIQCELLQVRPIRWTWSVCKNWQRSFCWKTSI